MFFKKFQKIVNPYLVSFTLLFLPIILINTSKLLLKDKEEQVDSTIFEKDEENKIYLRKLRSVGQEYYSDTEDICKRTSDGLKYYLQTGDTKYVDLYDFESRTDPSGKIQDLMEAFSENKSSKFRDYQWHNTIFVLLFVLALLFIVGWITCGICCCCNCKCCDFCINKSYLVPCFIVCTIMNLIIIVCCIIGLCKTKSNFRGAANGECAILHFINEGIDGESKESYPKWLGIKGTIDMLNSTYSQLNKISIKSEEINLLKNNDKKNSLIFEQQNKYKKNDYSGLYIDSDIEELLNNIRNNIEKLTISSEQTLIIRAITYILTLSDNLNTLKDFAGDNIADDGNYIHKAGKTVAYLFLILILIICLILELLLIAYVFKAYGNTCIKIAIHIFWFFFAILMIFSILLAMYWSLLCKLGPDVVKMFTYIIGEQNLKSSSPIILNDTEILNVCINGDGNLGKYLELEDIYNSYDNLVDYKREIDSILKESINKQDEIISKLNNTESPKNKLTEAKAILENYSYILNPVNPVIENIDLNLENGTALEYLDCSFLGRHLRTSFHYLNDSVKHQFTGFAVLFFIIGIAMAISIIFTIILVMIINKMVAFSKKPVAKQQEEEPKPQDTSKTQMSENDFVQNNPNPSPLENVRPPPVQEPEVEEKSEPPVEYNYEEPKEDNNYVEPEEDKNEVPFPMNTTNHEENY